MAGAACHALAPPAGPIPLEGTRAERLALAGTWEGKYWSESTGRHGRLKFRLRAGADTAYGEVDMIFSPALRVYGESAETNHQPLPRDPCTTIDIALVRVQGSSVRGTLAPYWDPDCDCRTSTVFEGKAGQDHIAGTFVSRRETAEAPVTGHWFADRRPE